MTDRRRESGLWAPNPETGFYEQQAQPASSGPYQYYQPPAASKPRPPHPATDTTRPPRVSAPGSRNADADDDDDDDDVPANLRQKAWSPAPDAVSPRTRGGEGKASQPNPASEVLRRGSVPERSPLQKLEAGFARKDEKRAKALEAERRASLRRAPERAGEDGGLARGGGVREDVRVEGERRRRGKGEGEEAEEEQRRRRQEEERRVRKEEARRARKEEKEPENQGEGRGMRQEHERAAAAAAPEGEGPRLQRLDTTRDGYGPRRPPAAAMAAQRPPSFPPATAMAAQPLPSFPPATTGGHDRFHRAANDLKQDTRSPRAPTNDYNRVQQESDPQMYAPRHSTDANTSVPVDRSGSKYRHRARDAGFVGAAAMAAEGSSPTPAERGKAAHERRKSLRASGKERSPRGSLEGGRGSLDGAGPRPGTSTEGNGGRSGSARQSMDAGPGVGRNGSKRLQKRPERYQGDGRNGNVDAYAREPGETRPGWQTSRMGGGLNREQEAAREKQAPDPLPREEVATGETGPLTYVVPPITAAGIAAREQVGFSAGPQDARLAPVEQEQHRRFGGVFPHLHHQEGRSYQASSQPLEEWRNAPAARLRAEDFEDDRLSTATARGADDDGAAWWEKNDRRTSGSGSGSWGSAPVAAPPPQIDGPYEEEAKHFRPPLFLKCGPLLRYTGLRTEREKDREVWRGSIMILTDDRQSEYSPAPTLRIFSQKMDLHTPPPQHLLESGHELPPEYEDPVAGQMKVSRTGRPLYVRHVREIDGEVDLSREENPQGLFSAQRAPMLGPQGSFDASGRESKRITFQNKTRVKRNSAEKAGRYREVRAHRLHAERGVTFWRFNLEIELGATQRRVAYRINNGPAIGFWVPARGETMHILFHSCNGFSLSVNPNEFSGPDPLWRDVLNRHQMRPFHVMLGGGDQIYNDAVMRDAPLFADWLGIKNPEHKHSAAFTHDMQEELEAFYLDRYAMWFSQGLFGMANAQIPMVNVWDDHDIIDGFGSYPHHFMAARVFAGLGAVAFKYYMLFQHQSIVAETEKEEPSWILGPSPGPYIVERSRSVYLSLGRTVGFLGLDCRTERMRDEILSQESYDVVFERLRKEIRDGETKHLIVLLGVPIAYPRLNFLENILTSRMMDPIKALGRTGLLGGFVNKFDGGVEILDDLDDHWTAKHHKQERNWFVQELQALAAEKSVRVTILGGDVHLGAVGQFYTPRKFGVSKDRDHRYMPNIISSAIVNTPPPSMMADVLNKRNKVHHLDRETDEDMIPMFEADVDGAKRNNKCLLPRRNYATIREYVPGSTPPPSPRAEEVQTPGGAAEPWQEAPAGPGQRDRRFPPGSMSRSMSLTRGPMKLVRRFSASGRGSGTGSGPGSAGGSAQQQELAGRQRSNSLGGAPAGHYPRLSGEPPGAAGAERPAFAFHRRPTDLSVKEARRAAAKGGATAAEADDLDGGREPGHIDLQGGLDISLRMEIDQKNPSGETAPYRILVPALWYDGAGDPNTARFASRGKGLMDRLRGRGKKGRGGLGEAGEGGSFDGSSRSGSLSPSPSPEPAPAPEKRKGFGGRFGSFRNKAAPPPQQQQQQQQQRVEADHRRAVSDPSRPPQASRVEPAYQKGYDLSSPPIGRAVPQQQQQQQQQRPGLHPHPQAPRAYYPPANNTPANAAPIRGGHNPYFPPVQQPPARGGAPFPQHDGAVQSDDEDLTPEDEIGARHAAPPVRRQSKAERFFGIGEDGQGQGGYVDADGGFGAQPERKRRGSWKIWQ